MSVKFPLYLKVCLVGISLYLISIIASGARNFILPLVFAGLLAILFSPVVTFLVNKGWNRTLAILSILITATSITFIAILLLSSQVDLLSESLPQMRLKFMQLADDSVLWLSDHYHLDRGKITNVIDQTTADIAGSSSAAIGSTLLSLGGVLAMVFLTPVYVFMILLYHNHLVEFVYRVFGESNNVKVGEIIKETKVIIQSYLVGLFTEFLIVAALNVTGLLILGIDYAVLLGICGALLNVIPYIGALISVGVFMLVALMTKTPVYLLYVAIMYLFIQFIDNNYVVPRIVGSRVKLNALVSLVVVVAGAAVWGIPGMFLSIPLLAIVKLIFDRIDGFKAWGFLLGQVVVPVKGKMPHEQLTSYIRTVLKTPANPPK
ncbi:MAG: AI-2E family transporter [Flavobacteriales bacterium]